MKKHQRLFEELLNEFNTSKQFNLFHNFISEEIECFFISKGVFCFGKENFLKEVYSLVNTINSDNQNYLLYMSNYQELNDIINISLIIKNTLNGIKTYAINILLKDDKIYRISINGFDNYIMQSLILSNRDYVIVKNISSNTILVLIDNTMIPFTKEEFSSYIKTSIISLIKEEDRERINKAFTCNDINKHEVFFYDIYDNKIHNKKIEISKIDNQSIYDNNSYILYVQSDITEEKKASLKIQEEYQKMITEIERAYQTQNDFFGRISHNFRTPLNAVIGFLNLATNNITNQSDALSYINKAKQSSKYLLSLINDTLDLAKLENNSLILNSEKMNIIDIFDDINTYLEKETSLKKIEYSYNFIGDNDLYHIGDESRLRCVIHNLIDNALKFTPECGSIDLLVEEQNTKDNQTILRVIINDTGCGMHKEFIPKAFEPYNQEFNYDLAPQGNGLGLTIAKKIVDLMNGSITIQSEYQKGTTVRLEIPLKKYSELKKDTIDTFDFSGKRVLIVEDNELNILIAKKLLQGLHISCDVETNGEKGLNRFISSNENYYDLILMDIRMPVMNGYEASKCIRSLNRSDVKDIPIIAFSANTFDEDIKKCYEMGMNDYLSKPIDQRVLYKKLQKYLNKGANNE